MRAEGARPISTAFLKGCRINPLALWSRIITLTISARWQSSRPEWNTIIAEFAASGKDALHVGNVRYFALFDSVGLNELDHPTAIGHE